MIKVALSLSLGYLFYYRNNNNNKAETAGVADMVYLHENCKPRQAVEPERAEQTPDQWCLFGLSVCVWWVG